MGNFLDYIFWGQENIGQNFSKEGNLVKLNFGKQIMLKYFGEQSRNFKLFQRIKKHGPLGSPSSKLNSMDPMKAITLSSLHSSQ